MNFVNFLQKGVNFYVNFRANFAFLGVIFAVVLAFVGCGVLNDNAANSASSNLAKPKNSTQSWIKSVIKKSPESDIVKQLRGNEKRKAIHEITQYDMRILVRSSSFGTPPNISTGGISKYTMQAYERMFQHRADIITALREAGYSQAQIAAAYTEAFVWWSSYCKHALSDSPYESGIVEGFEAYCGYYESEFAGVLDELQAAGVRDEFGRGINYHYADKEVPKLVAAEYDKQMSDEELHNANLRLKRLGDRDLGVNLERKAKLDAMVDSLTLRELAGILSDENAAISELKISGLTQEQASIVMSDVFFRYANQCERAKNAVSAECELYFQHFAPLIPLENKQRNYLGYSRAVMSANVARFYGGAGVAGSNAGAFLGAGMAGSINSSGAGAKNGDGFSAGANSANNAYNAGTNSAVVGQGSPKQRANDNKMSWQQVFEIVSQLAGVAKFALQFL